MGMARERTTYRILVGNGQEEHLQAELPALLKEYKTHLVLYRRADTQQAFTGRILTVDLLSITDIEPFANDLREVFGVTDVDVVPAVTS